MRAPELLLAAEYDHGLVATRVRGGQWRRVARGAYVDAGRVTEERDLALARIAAVHARLRTPHWFSHESAAIVWGLPLWTTTGRVHVRQAGRASGRRDRSVSRHVGEVRLEHQALVAGLPVTDIAQTMVDCARTMGPLPALVVADAALRAGADRDVAAAMLQNLDGRPGVARARHLLAVADAGAESPGETATRFVLLRDGLPAPETQIEVVTRLGTFWPDLGWRRWRLLLEYDGRIKYTDRRDLIAEKRRHDAIVEVGWRLLRVTAEDLRGSLLAQRVLSVLPVGVPRTSRPLLRG